jgi:flagellar biosynthesis protein
MFTRRLHFKRDVDDHKPSQAIALAYDPERNNAPVVLAAGKGAVAERILAEGQVHHIPAVDDPLLAAALTQVDVGAEIPPELYALVAEVLAYVYRIRRAGS